MRSVARARGQRLAFGWRFRGVSRIPAERAALALNCTQLDTHHEASKCPPPQRAGQHARVGCPNFAGRHEDALEQLRLTLALDSEFELAYLWSGWALEALQRYDEAQYMVEQALARSSESGIGLASLARIQALRGEREAAERTLGKLMASNGYIPAYEIGKAWLALGDTRRANDWLQKAFDERSHSFVFLRVDPQLSSHRQNEEFQRLAARVK